MTRRQRRKAWSRWLKSEVRALVHENAREMAAFLREHGHDAIACDRFVEVWHTSPLPGPIDLSGASLDAFARTIDAPTS